MVIYFINYQKIFDLLYEIIFMNYFNLGLTIQSIFIIILFNKILNID